MHRRAFSRRDVGVSRLWRGLPAAARDRRDACAPLLHGESFVCLDEAVSQARRFHTTWQTELVRYVVHGVLHLLGYDDAASRARHKLKEAEDTLVGRLARQFDFRSLPATQRPGSGTPRQRRPIDNNSANATVPAGG